MAEITSEIVRNALAGDQLSGNVTFTGVFRSAMKNPLIVTGLFITIASKTWKCLCHIFGWIEDIVLHRFVSKIEIRMDHECFQWIRHWLAHHYEAQSERKELDKTSTWREYWFELWGHGRRKTQSRQGEQGNLPINYPVWLITSGLAVKEGYSVAEYQNGIESEIVNQKGWYELSPGIGVHWLRYQGVWIRIDYVRDEQKVYADEPFETITLSTLASYKKVVLTLLNEARLFCCSSSSEMISVYVVNAKYKTWEMFGNSRRMRDLDSVILPHSFKETLLKDIHRFLSRRQWYEKRGIPHRRGYMLHGSPGSGKTSFIKALAGSIAHNICILNLAEPTLTDESLLELLSELPSKSIIVLEDVDAAFGRRNEAKDEQKPKVTFSGLLNALDGVASANSFILFMTTNHLERLDPALVRPGRTDMIFELPDAKPAQVKEMLLHFYFSDLFEQRLMVARQEHKVQFESWTEKDMSSAPDAHAPYYQKANETTSRELSEWGDELGRLVQQVTHQRREALQLDADGFPPGENPRDKPKHVGRFASKGGVSMAELQNLFVQFPEDAVAAVKFFAKDNDLKLSK